MDKSSRKASMARMMQGDASDDDDQKQLDGGVDDSTEGPGVEAVEQIAVVLQQLLPKLPDTIQGLVSQAADLLAQASQQVAGGQGSQGGSDNTEGAPPVAENSVGQPFPGGPTA